jgi:hypothetical protein
MTLSNVANPNSIDTLQASAAMTVSGASAGLTGYAAARNLVIQLEVTAVTGTLPTLDLLIQDTVDGTNWFTIATFTQVTAAAVAVQRVSTAFTDQIRTSYTITGTTPSFTFNVKTFADA